MASFIRAYALTRLFVTEENHPMPNQIAGANRSGALPLQCEASGSRWLSLFR
jgi:hypothetical protein